MTMQLYHKRAHLREAGTDSFITVDKPCTRISFSKPLADWIDDNDIHHFTLWHDLDDGKIAFVKSGSKEGYSVKRRQRIQAIISVKNFIKFCGIATGRYLAEITPDNQSIIVSINQPAGA